MFKWMGFHIQEYLTAQIELAGFKEKKNENKVGWAGKAGIWEELWEGGYEQNILHENFKELIRINKLIKKQKCK